MSVALRAYRVLTSERATALLVIGVAGAVALASTIPQGEEALEIAKDVHASAIHTFYALGLTDVFSSPWLAVLGVLLAANLLGLTIRLVRAPSSGEGLPLPSATDLETRLVAEEPEHAVHRMHALFRGLFGAPARDEVQKGVVRLVFDTAPSARMAPMATHLGLVVLILGAGLSAQVSQSERGLARVELDVKNVPTGKTGSFDIVQGEAWQFFQSAARYTLRGAMPNFEGLGPAVRLERSEGTGRREEFWVFKNAPEGFDERHRQGEVAITVTKLGTIAPPGRGVGSSLGALLLLAGVGLLAFGLSWARQSAGLLWVEADGESVVLRAVPRAFEDRQFRDRFNVWATQARSVLTPEL